MAPLQLITRDGRFEVTSSTWDHNGSHDVKIIDHRAGSVGETVPPNVIERERAQLRRLARRADPMQHLAQWTRLDTIDEIATDDGPRLHYSYTVSRLDGTYR